MHIRRKLGLPAPSSSVTAAVSLLPTFSSFVCPSELRWQLKRKEAHHGVTRSWQRTTNYAPAVVVASQSLRRRSSVRLIFAAIVTCRDWVLWLCLPLLFFLSRWSPALTWATSFVTKALPLWAPAKATKAGAGEMVWVRCNSWNGVGLLIKLTGVRICILTNDCSFRWYESVATTNTYRLMIARGTLLARKMHVWKHCFQLQGSINCYLRSQNEAQLDSSE
jgi:hypothetical protein